MQMFASLAGKKAVVFGASQGIGRAIALSFAKQGAQVAVLSRSEEKLGELVKELEGKNHKAIPCDVSDLNNLKNKINDLLTEWKNVDIVVCNTGGPKPGPITEAADEEFLNAFRDHVLANSLTIKLLLPGMKKHKFGRIINIISTSVKTPIPNLGVSNTIRAAVANWAKTLSLEVGQFGVTVNNILPGYTKTPRLEALLKSTAQKQDKNESEIENIWKATIPMGRLGEPEEIANAATFLASPEASYISGINLPVDGGRTASL
jgi:3-oxoacyl-[acyl-carrier protein] reductase